MFLGFSRSRDFSVINNIRLPSSRVVSLSNVIDVDNPHTDLTLSVMQWGQLIDHDLTHVPVFRFGKKHFFQIQNFLDIEINSSFSHNFCWL